jgi:hypothetical protein
MPRQAARGEIDDVAGMRAVAVHGAARQRQERRSPNPGGALDLPRRIGESAVAVIGQMLTGLIILGPSVKIIVGTVKRSQRQSTRGDRRPSR